MQMHHPLKKSLLKRIRMLKRRMPEVVVEMADSEEVEKVATEEAEVEEEPEDVRVLNDPS